MRTIPYDPSRSALYQPGKAPTLLNPGVAYSDELLCAEAARLVYKPFERSPAAAAELTAALAAVGYQETEFFDQSGAPALAAVNPASGATLIAFRGTTRALKDILADLKTWPKNWAGGGSVHAGFCDVFERHRSQLTDWLADHSGPCLMTGHSLGGALATLAASIFKPVRLITFGMPRIGDLEYCAGMASIDASRYVNCCDLVTRLPPEFLGYRHGGTLHYIDREGVIHTNPDGKFVRQDRRQAQALFRQAYGLLPDTVKLRQFADHAPINYIYAIQAADDLRS